MIIFHSFNHSLVLSWLATNQTLRPLRPGNRFISAVDAPESISRQLDTFIDYDVVVVMENQNLSMHFRQAPASIFRYFKPRHLHLNKA